MNISYCCDEPALWSQSVGKVIQHKPHGFVMEMPAYKYRTLSFTESQNSLSNSGESHSKTEDMAPQSTIASSFQHQRFNDKEKLKLRKPIVEKMRRDRINSCIDQLKKLLEKELHSQDPSTRLEKADILEMTVSFLKEQQRLPSALAQRDYDQGYFHCWRESLEFLNMHSRKGQSAQEIQEIQQSQCSSTELSCSASVPRSKHKYVAQPQSDRPVWRPW